MDHPRPRGLAAFVISAVVVITVAPVASATVAARFEPPLSGVGGASLAPSNATNTEGDPAGEPVDRTREAADAEAGAETPLEDPMALAARIAARLDARSDARPEAQPEARPSVTPPATGSPSSDAASAAAAESAADDGFDATAPLPAPRPSGRRFIDRFAPTSAVDESTASTSEGDVMPMLEGWWNAPELRVGLLLAAFVGVAAMMRRWSNTRGPRAGRPSGVVSVLARYPFGRGASLVLLEVGPRVVLVHQHGGRGGEVRPVAEFTSPEEIVEIRARLGMARRAEEPGFDRDLHRELGLYDRRGRPAGFGGPDGLPLDDAMETVDLTRRRPRRGSRTR